MCNKSVGSFYCDRHIQVEEIAKTSGISTTSQDYLEMCKLTDWVCISFSNEQMATRISAISRLLKRVHIEHVFFFFVLSVTEDVTLVHCCEPGPSCSKLTMSLVNDSLKYTSSDMLKFFAEKKNIRILCIESAKTVNQMTLKELVKLTML